MSTLVKDMTKVEFSKHPMHRDAYTKLVTGKSENDRLSASIVRINPGGELIPHTHEVIEVFYIIEGQGSALVNGERKPVSGGTVLIVPAGEEHGLINVGKGELTLYAVFSPGVA